MGPQLAGWIDSFGSTTFHSPLGFIALVIGFLLLIWWGGISTMTPNRSDMHPVEKAANTVHNSTGLLYILVCLIGLAVLIAGAFGIDIPALLNAH